MTFTVSTDFSFMNGYLLDAVLVSFKSNADWTRSNRDTNFKRTAPKTLAVLDLVLWKHFIIIVGVQHWLENTQFIS